MRIKQKEQLHEEIYYPFARRFFEQAKHTRDIFILVLLLASLDAMAQLGRYQADIRVWPQDFCDTIAIQWEHDQIYVPVTVGGHSYRFLFDTGASQAVVFSGTPLAEAPRVSSLLSHDAAGHTDTVAVVQLPPLQVGKSTLSGCHATVQPRGLGTRGIDGILGFDLVNSGLQLKIDAKAGRLIISDRPCCFDHEEWVTPLKYRLSYHVPYIDVIPFGRQYERVLFDTGSRNFFSMNVDRFLEAEEQRHRFDRPYRVEGRTVGRHAIGHGGIEPLGEVFFLRLDSMALGDCSFSSVHAITTQGGSHIGAALLRFGAVAFCPKHKRMFFQPYGERNMRVDNKQLDIAFVTDEQGRPQVGLVWPESTPYRRGFRQGDVIIAIDGRPVLSLPQFMRWPFEPGRKYRFTVLGTDGRRRDIEWVRLPA